jgi:hypothetical protein
VQYILDVSTSDSSVRKQPHLPLLVVTAGDFDDVALELVSEGVNGDLLAHALLVKDSDLSLIVNVDELRSMGVISAPLDVFCGPWSHLRLQGLPGLEKTWKKRRTTHLLGAVCRERYVNLHGCDVAASANDAAVTAV